MNLLTDGITVMDIVFILACIWAVLVILIGGWWITTSYHPMLDEELKDTNKENEKK